MLNLFGGRSKPAEAALTTDASGVPLELIRYDASTGKFQVGEQALAALRKVKTPIGVVSVCGRARQGKSFILNQLLGTAGGFQVGPTVRPCTKGLWMWSSPVKRTAPDGSAYHLVLLDTEGVDAYDQTGQYSTQIFSLAILLSSLFVYNQMGGIDESSLDRLSLVTQMTKKIRVRANEGSASEAELSSFTPAFLWLLRDFYLRLEGEDGRKITARDYLETALAAVAGTGPDVEAKNQIRESIKALFPDRDCATLVRPVNDEALLSKLDSVPKGQLRPEFVQGLQQLLPMVLRKAQPKRLGSTVVTGPVLAALAEAYVSAINTGAVPTIATAWQGVAETECRRACDAAIAAYQAAFDASVPVEEARMNAEHVRCVQLANTVFEDGAVGHEAPRAANQQRLGQALEAAFHAFRSRRLTEAALTCSTMLRDAHEHMASAARQPGASVQQLHAALASFQSQYESKASGPSKWQEYNAFVTGPFSRLLEDVAARQQRAAEEARKAAEAQSAAEHARVQQLHAERSGLETRAKQAEARASAAVAEVAALQTRLTQLQTQADAAVAAARDAAGQQASGEVARLRLEAEQLRNQVEELMLLKIELERKLRVAEEAQQRQEQHSATLAAQNKDLQGQLAAAQAAAARIPAVHTSPAPAPDVDMASPEATNVNSMTIPQLKQALMDAGLEADVWTLANNKKAKKADWVALARAKLQ